MKNTWETTYNDAALVSRPLLLPKVWIHCSFIAGLCFFFFAFAFIVLNITNLLAITLNLILSIALFGMIESFADLVKPRRIEQNSDDLVIQKLGDQIRMLLDYRRNIIFRVNPELNAFAAKRFGLFGTRIVEIGSPILASQDFDAICFILSHEVSHLKNGDNFISGLSAIVTQWIGEVSNALNPFSEFHIKSQNILVFLSKTILFIVFLPVVFLLYITYNASSILSHQHELRADVDAINAVGTFAAEKAARLLAYIEFFENNNGDENQREKVRRFLSWIPFDIRHAENWMARSRPSLSHPSTRQRYDLARRMNVNKANPCQGFADFEALMKRYVNFYRG
jgi:Zn-dependent protease with chaperone function